MNTLLDIIKEIECLLWAVVILVALYMVLKYCCLPIIQLYHERKMKADAFDREKEWADLLELKASTDDALKEKMDDLNKEKKKLEAELEMEKYNRGLLEKQLKQYSDIFADLKVEIKPKEDNK